MPGPRCFVSWTGLTRATAREETVGERWPKVSLVTAVGTLRYGVRPLLADSGPCFHYLAACNHGFRIPYLSALQALRSPDVLEQATRGVFDHVQHAIETAPPAEIGIGHFFLRPISSKLHEQTDARFMARRTDVD